MTVAQPTDVYRTLNLVVQCLCIPIVSAAVALRFYTRFRFKQRLGVEDCGFSFGPFLYEFPLTWKRRCMHGGLGMLNTTAFDDNQLLTAFPGPVYGILRSQYSR